MRKRLGYGEDTPHTTGKDYVMIKTRPTQTEKIMSCWGETQLERKILYHAEETPTQAREITCCLRDASRERELLCRAEETPQANGIIRSC